MPYVRLTKASRDQITKKPVRLHSVERWWLRYRWRVKLTTLAVLGGLVASALVIWWLRDTPLASPLSSLSSFRFLRQSELPHTRNKLVYGFLPYWNLSDVTIQPELSHLSYFALAIGPSGQVRLREDGSSEPGYAKFNSDALLDIVTTAEKQNTKYELVLSQFLSDDISQFLGSKPAQQKLFETLDSILLAYPISGINIDIEPTGTPTDTQRTQFLEFIQNLRKHLDDRYGHIQISVDVYASASNNKQLWDIPNLASSIDYLVVMAYDFHRRTSPQAGPVAPLFGGKVLWDSDINDHLREFLTMIPPSKILLGIPFYGYEWQTTSRDSQSHVFPDSGTTARITRVKELQAQADELQVIEHWNEDALSPYLSYVENGETYVLYYENSRSLSYKLDYVNQLDLAGIAIWALGYEGSDRELWDIIANKLE